MTLLDFVMAAGWFRNRAEARHAIRNGEVTCNDVALTDPALWIEMADYDWRRLA
jgi:predicted rRNA methylase YqxC with S4 and FtsJ domains